MRDHPACEDCVLKYECLFMHNDDVESCGDVQDYDAQNYYDNDKEEIKNNEK